MGELFKLYILEKYRLFNFMRLWPRKMEQSIFYSWYKHSNEIMWNVKSFISIWLCTWYLINGIIFIHKVQSHILTVEYVFKFNDKYSIIIDPILQNKQIN